MCSKLWTKLAAAEPAHDTDSYLSSSLSFSASKVSSQPASMRILMPPSSSSRDCDAAEADCAPRRGVKLNMAAARDVRRHAEANYQAKRIAGSIAAEAMEVMGRLLLQGGGGGRDARVLGMTATLALALVSQLQLQLQPARRVSWWSVRAFLSAARLQTRQTHRRLPKLSLQFPFWNRVSLKSGCLAILAHPLFQLPPLPHQTTSLGGPIALVRSFKCLPLPRPPSYPFASDGSVAAVLCLRIRTALQLRGLTTLIRPELTSAYERS